MFKKLIILTLFISSVGYSSDNDKKVILDEIKAAFCYEEALSIAPDGSVADRCESPISLLQKINSTLPADKSSFMSYGEEHRDLGLRHGIETVAFNLFGKGLLTEKHPVSNADLLREIKQTRLYYENLEKFNALSEILEKSQKGFADNTLSSGELDELEAEAKKLLPEGLK